MRGGGAPIPRGPRATAGHRRAPRHRCDVRPGHDSLVLGGQRFQSHIPAAMPGVMRYRLTSTDGLQQHELRAGVQLVVGRAPSSDIAIFDPTISRKHAELQVDANGLRVRDLGSSNGTFHNGTRIEDAQPVVLAPGDTITFGKVAFRVQPVGPAAIHSPSGNVATPSGESHNGRGPSATIVRELRVRDAHRALEALGTSDPRISTAPNAAATLTEDKSEQKLATLLEVSKGLGKSVDIEALLEKIVRYAYQILEVDR